MKLLQIIITILVISIPSIINAESQKEIIIEKHQGDVNGDGLTDEIILKGVPLSEDGDYYHNVWAEIISVDGEWRINYRDGYNPKIQLIDVNHDRVLEILYQSTYNNVNGKHRQKLHTLTKERIDEIDLPKLQYVTGKFVDDFKVNLHFSPYEKPIQVNVADRSNTYIEAGIYDENGTLTRNKSLVLNQVSKYEPIKLNKQKGYGIKSTQPVFGISNSDQLGIIETLWYYKDGSWVTINSEWKKAQS